MTPRLGHSPLQTTHSFLVLKLVACQTPPDGVLYNADVVLDRWHLLHMGRWVQSAVVGSMAVGGVVVGGTVVMVVVAAMARQVRLEARHRWGHWVFRMGPPPPPSSPSKL